MYQTKQMSYNTKEKPICSCRYRYRIGSHSEV